MIELLLLAGSALCVISVVMAIVSLARTQAPRGAAIAFMLGLILLFVAAWMQPSAVDPRHVVESWQRLLGGQLSIQDAPDLTR